MRSRGFSPGLTQKNALNVFQAKKRLALVAELRLPETARVTVQQI